MCYGLGTNLHFLLSLIEFEFHEVIFVFICLLVKYFAPELLHQLIIHFQVDGDPQPIKAVHLGEGKNLILKLRCFAVIFKTRKRQWK